MIEICPPKECTGCGACAGVCPKDCIEMQPEGVLGYIHPVIDQTRCIDCGLCARVCPCNSNAKFKVPEKVYASWSRDCADRESSTSGGIGSVLAQHFVENGGVVYGAVAKENMRVFHERTTSTEEIKKFKKSKYVQSTVSRDIYVAIKHDLKTGLQVLFTGTPCQTAAIRSAMKSHPGLTCVDIVCHGVPSQTILREHVKMVYGSPDKIEQFTTRDTDGYFLTLYSGGRQVYRKGFPSDSYLYGFQYGLFFRENCYACRYARPERQSDLTIGDFWGLGDTSYPHKKVSEILVNTEKGAALIDNVREKLFLEERTLQEAINGNPQLRQPARHHQYYNLFARTYNKFGYPAAIKLALLKFRVIHAVFKILVKIPGFSKWYSAKKQTDK